MNTVSAYFATVGHSLEELMNPYKKKEFHQFISYYEGEAKGFFTRLCCNEHKWFDQSKPGLFKVEAGVT